MSDSIILGRGTIDASLLNLSLDKFFKVFTKELRSNMFLDNTDEEIDIILTDLWNSANKVEDGSVTVVKKAKSTKSTTGTGN